MYSFVSFSLPSSEVNLVAGGDRQEVDICRCRLVIRTVCLVKQQGEFRWELFNSYKISSICELEE